MRCAMPLTLPAYMRRRAGASPGCRRRVTAGVPPGNRMTATTRSPKTAAGSIRPHPAIVWCTYVSLSGKAKRLPEPRQRLTRFIQAFGQGRLRRQRQRTIGIMANVSSCVYDDHTRNFLIFMRFVDNSKILALSVETALISP